MHVDDPKRPTDLHAAKPNHEPNGTTDQSRHDTADDPNRTGAYIPGSVPEPGTAAGATAAVAPSIPGYEIVGVLGRGGMGVVYKARHLALKRTVALKMILAGGHAGPRELARFRIEAEAVARLQHPNIVQIHEVGEADGHPYCALEFVEGGNLAGRIAGKPMPAREAARVVEVLARAMQLAHSRNVVHRDLKPANVLLAADGTPRITDFGLARQLDSDSGETQAGAVMGTPSYMAPEQASGHAHEAGPAADVYALGAILYDCLAGRPPFKGSSVVETLDQVRTQEPVPPSRLQASVPLDLDTICLKCLRKEPEKRYSSAAELADELVRFQRGEPVQARPVGRIERGWRWCRRNPALAAAAVVVVGVLVAASVVSTLFGIDARNEAKAAVEARNDLAKTNAELVQSKSEAEGAAARGWLSPLAEGSSPLTDGEIGAFASLAAYRNKPLADRFVTEALSSREGVRKLRTRSAFVPHAIVGLDARKRQEFEQRLLGAMAESNLSEESRLDLALTMTGLGELSRPATAVAARTLLQTFPKTNDPVAIGSLAEALTTVAARLEPQEATEATTTITQTMTRTTNFAALKSLTESLTALATRLQPKEATVTATGLIQALTKTTDHGARKSLVQGLAAVTVRLDPQESARISTEAAGLLTQDLTKSTNPPAILAAAESLVVVSARLDPKGAAGIIAQAMTLTTDFASLSLLADGLVAATARLEPEEAAQILTQAMTRTTYFGALQSLTNGLTSVAARLEPKPAADAVATIIRVMSKLKDPTALKSLADGLSPLAARLEPRDAVDAAAGLLKAMTESSDLRAFKTRAEALNVVAAHLDPELAAEAAAKISLAMTKTTDRNTLDSLLDGLSAVAVRLEAKDAANVAARLRQTMTETENPIVLAFVAQGLSAVAPRLEPKEAAEAAAAFRQAMTKTNEPFALLCLADGLSARLAPEEATTPFTQAIAKTRNPFALKDLAQALASAAARVEPKEAARVSADAATKLTQVMGETNNPFALGALAEGLAPLTAWLEPKEAARVSADAAKKLIQAMTKANELTSLQSLRKGLSAVGTRLEPKNAADVVTALTQAMTKTNDYPTLQTLAEAVSSVSARLETKGVAETAAILKQAITGSNDPRMVQFLSQSLSVVAARLEPREAAEAVATLAQALAKTKDAFALRSLAEGVSALADRLEPAEAESIVAAFRQAMTNTKDPLTLRSLAEGMSAVMTRLGPKEAVPASKEAAAELTKAMAMTEANARHAHEPLARGLAAILSGDQKDARTRAVAAAVGCLNEGDGLASALVLLRVAVEPIPRRLSDQDLVELLKQPLCVGPARRAILDQLEHHHRRTFTDQWDFVRYAEEQRLRLDFTSPPQRP